MLAPLPLDQLPPALTQGLAQQQGGRADFRSYLGLLGWQHPEAWAGCQKKWLFLEGQESQVSPHS